jgi:hypothetical protein
VTLSRNGFGGFGGRGRAPGAGTGTIPKNTANGGSTTPSGSGAPGGRPSGAAPRGGFPGGGAGFAGGNSKSAKALQACRSKLGSSGFGGRFGAGRGGAGGAGAGNSRPQFTTAALKSYVACIRKNGYAAMPQPKASGTGSFFPVSVEKNAKFQAANKKCESVLLKGVRRPSAGAGSGGGAANTISGTSTTASA